MIVLVYQHNGCLIIYISEGAICKHYRTLHIKENGRIPIK